MQSAQERSAMGTSPKDSVALPVAPQEPPRRHGADLKRSRAMAARLRWMIDGDPEPDASDWQAMGMALWDGDPLADEVAAWMLAQGGARAWPLVQEALGMDPASAAQDARVPGCLARLISRVHARPAWLDEARLRRGARVLQTSGRLGTMVLRDAALMAGYQASAINQTLLRTGQLQRGAPQRIAETALWWLMCTDDGGLNPGAPGHVMTIKVRLMHALVRVRLQRAPDWDAAELGVPINQLDMQATYLAFSAVQLLGLRMTGDIFSRQDANAVMHLWRYVGWLMGVDECWLCDDEQTGRVLLYRNLLSQAPSDASSVALGRALMSRPTLLMLAATYALWALGTTVLYGPSPVLAVILTGLAVAIPAQVGLVMIGGEGALAMGGLAGAGAALALSRPLAAQSLASSPRLSRPLLALRRLLAAMVARHKSLSDARRQGSDSSIEFNASDVTRFLLLSTINEVLQRGSKTTFVAHHFEANTAVVHAVDFFLQVRHEQAHEAGDLFFRAFPVFGTEGEQAQVVHSHFGADFDDIAHLLGPSSMPKSSRHKAPFGPAAVAIHDDGDVLRKGVVQSGVGQSVGRIWTIADFIGISPAIGEMVSRFDNSALSRPT